MDICRGTIIIMAALIDFRFSADVEIEPVKSSAPSETVPVQEQLREKVKSAATQTGVAENEQSQQQQQQQQDANTEEAAPSAVASEVPPKADTEPSVLPKTEPESPGTDPDFKIIEIVPVNIHKSQAPVPDTTAPGQSNQAPVSADADKPVSVQQKPKPYYPGDVQTVLKFGANVPLFMEFLQPFHQAFQPFPQAFRPFPQANHNQPPRHQQQPYGASVDPFDPFANSARSPFNQLVEAYTNEFRSKIPPRTRTVYFLRRHYKTIWHSFHLPISYYNNIVVYVVPVRALYRILALLHNH